jgi:hypothetical protein
LPESLCPYLPKCLVPFPNLLSPKMRHPRIVVECRIWMWQRSKRDRHLATICGCQPLSSLLTFCLTFNWCCHPCFHKVPLPLYLRGLELVSIDVFGMHQISRCCISQS